MIEVGIDPKGEVLSIIRTRSAAVAAHMHMHREVCKLDLRAGARPPISMSLVLQESILCNVVLPRGGMCHLCSVGSAPPRAQGCHKCEYEAIALPCIDIIRGTIGICDPPTSVGTDR